MYDNQCAQIRLPTPLTLTLFLEVCGTLIRDRPSDWRQAELGGEKDGKVSGVAKEEVAHLARVITGGLASSQFGRHSDRQWDGTYLTYKLHLPMLSMCVANSGGFCRARALSLTSAVPSTLGLDYKLHGLFISRSTSRTSQSLRLVVSFQCVAKQDDFSLADRISQVRSLCTARILNAAHLPYKGVPWTQAKDSNPRSQTVEELYPNPRLPPLPGLTNVCILQPSASYTAFLITLGSESLCWLLCVTCLVYYEKRGWDRIQTRCNKEQCGETIGELYKATAKNNAIANPKF
ncbi:hypothetical protein RRG08_024265 [Elysia crispata]|uniref:Uncharacterized protein n=1 Tax=Elysia crispata TaxID=231223 RepID=A0AAE1D9J4_9GAST|nr:hypothetical protein RRG08_024265 [Elysia crispata]